MPDEKPEIGIQIERRDGDPVPIRGGFGGVTADGLVYIHLYSEHPTLPGEIRHVIHDGHIEEVAIPFNITRTVHTTCMLAPMSARQIGAWLLNKADEAEDRQKQVAIDDDED